VTVFLSDKETLRRLVKEVLKGKPEKYVKRAKYEVRIIEKLKFSSYFLILQDIVKEAERRDILVGFGRGSVAGSLVAYLLGIHKVNPIKYGLIFERFLNLSRVSMPDIDIDFEKERRGEMLQYVKDKYGEANVAQIMTFSIIRARSAIKDVARVLGISQREADRISKMIPYKGVTTIEQALKLIPELRREKRRYPKLFAYASRLSRTPRHVSIHPSGVVIGDQPLREIAPLQLIKGVRTMQLDMYDAEGMGLLKIDFLGIASLSVVKETLDIINANR